MPNGLVELNVAIEDVTRFSCDLLVLKHAQSLFGADLAVYNSLVQAGNSPDLPGFGDYAIVASHGVIAARELLFLGVEPLRNFGYSEIREFGRRAVAFSSQGKRFVERIALTLHGPGFGLDEVESFESLLAGMLDAIYSGEYPASLLRITFVERDQGRAHRLQSLLEKLIPSGKVRRSISGVLEGVDDAARKTLRTAGYGAASKKRVFVAMPFAEEMTDTFHYGIQNAINAVGMLAERADRATYTGDVMQWVKEHIDTAYLLVADLTWANPNVYLEVGYAWGKQVPTVLIIKFGDELKFDVRGQHVLMYKSIKHLEDLLANELACMSTL